MKNVFNKIISVLMYSLFPLALILNIKWNKDLKCDISFMGNVKETHEQWIDMYQEFEKITDKDCE